MPCAMFKGGSIAATAAWKVADAASVSSLCCVQLDSISDGQQHRASAVTIIAVLIVEVSTIDSGNW